MTLENASCEKYKKRARETELHCRSSALYGLVLSRVQKAMFDRERERKKMRAAPSFSILIHTYAHALYSLWTLRHSRHSFTYDHSSSYPVKGLTSFFLSLSVSSTLNRRQNIRVKGHKKKQSMHVKYFEWIMVDYHLNNVAREWKADIFCKNGKVI